MLQGGWDWYRSLAWYAAAPRLADVLLVFAVQFAAYWSLSIAFLVVDVYRWPQCIHRRKLQPTAPPYTSGQLRHIAWTVLRHQLVWFVPLFLAVLSALERIPCPPWLLKGGAEAEAAPFGLRSSGMLSDVLYLDTSLSVPTGVRLAVELVGCILLLELFFFLVHRSLHISSLYRFHAQHHSLKAPVGMAADYMGHVEFVLMMMAGVAAALAMRAHVVSTALFFAIGNGGGVLTHSGYRMPWVHPFSRADLTAYHDAHHAYRDSNLSFLGVLDWLCGSRTQWDMKAKEYRSGIEGGSTRDVVPQSTARVSTPAAVHDVVKRSS